MKKIIIILVFLVAVPAIVLGNNAAPYTEDALQKVLAAIGNTPKVESSNISSREEFHKQFIEYYSTVFKKAGYSFNDTINKIVADMKNNPDAIPKDRQTVYNNLYILLNIMTYECSSDNVDCLQFFPEDTKQSIQWFTENSEFNKKDNNSHHMGIPKESKLK